jgi:hypothetical protein
VPFFSNPFCVLLLTPVVDVGSETDLLPEWVRSELDEQNPNHPFLRQPTEVCIPRSAKRQAPDASSSSPAADALTRSAKKAKKQQEEEKKKEGEEVVASGPDELEFP